MQAAYYAVAGATLVILDEVRGSYEFGEALFAERLEEIATLITEETWLEDDNLGDRSGDKLHSGAGATSYRRCEAGTARIGSSP